MALARMLCVSGNDVQVWSALPAEVENLSATRVHPNLPGMKIPEELQFTKSIEEVCTGKDVLLFAVPSVFVRSTTAKARPYIPDGQILVDVAKGMEPETLYTMTEVIADELNKEGGPQNAKLVAPFRPDPMRKRWRWICPPPSFRPARMKPRPSMCRMCSATPVCVCTPTPTSRAWS